MCTYAHYLPIIYLKHTHTKAKKLRKENTNRKKKHENYLKTNQHLYIYSPNLHIYTT